MLGNSGGRRVVESEAAGELQAEGPAQRVAQLHGTCQRAEVLSARATHALVHSHSAHSGCAAVSSVTVLIAVQRSPCSSELLEPR